jgi:hypothetical protein
MTLEVPFEHRGLAGRLAASVRRNEDPARWGYRAEDFGEHIELATGFPVCHAVVDHSGQGYDRLMGWVQIVWSGPPGGAAGEFDPWATFDKLDLPYCWFGFAPDLFDGPFRGDRTADLDWEAHSWLCAPPASLIGREVAMLAGFRWGFQLRAGQIAVFGPSPLENLAWDRDLPILWRRCPSWRFITAETDS